MEDTRIKSRIIAVGYEIDYASVLDLIEQHYPGIKEIQGKWVVLSGVYYASDCRGVTPADKKTDADLTGWFKRRVGKASTGKLRRLYISRRGDAVAAEIQFATDVIYSFVLNRESKSTSLQKKLIHDKDPLYRAIEMEATVPCRPYRHTERTTLKKVASEFHEGHTFWDTVSVVNDIEYE